VPLVEQELLTLPEHPSSPPVLSGVRVNRSLVLYICFVDRCLSFCTFFFWPLCCLFFFDIRILLSPLVSSTNSSYTNILTENIELSYHCSISMCIRCQNLKQALGNINTFLYCTPWNIFNFLYRKWLGRL
jgi:hypothetical protein